MALDKWFHLGAGALVSLLAYLVFNNIPLAFGAALIAGVCKEYCDSKNTDKHVVEVMDVVATCSGGLIMCLIIYFV